MTSDAEGLRDEGERGLLLTALLGVLVGVVPAVVLTVTLPGQRLAEGVITLELIQGALSRH